MALNNCIDKMKGAGQLTDAQADLAMKEAERLENVYRTQKTYPEAEIRSRAEADATENMVKRVQQDKYRIAKQAEMMSINKTHLEESDLGKVGGLREMLVSLDRGAEFSVENNAAAIFGHSTSHLGQFAEKFRSKIPSGIDLYFQGRKEAIRDVAAALFGEKPLNKIHKEFADAYRVSIDSLLTRLERTGVPVARIKDYGVQMRWDAVKTNSLTKEQFAKKIAPLLDRLKTLDEKGNRFTDEELDIFLQKVHESILDRGKVGRASNIPIGGTANSARELHRQLHFKSSKEFFEANEEFGNGELFDSMMETLQEYSMDIALAERFGPNPDAGFRALNELAQKDIQAGVKRPHNRLILETGALNNEMIYNTLRGRTSGVGSVLGAAAMSSARNIQSYLALGKAFLASLGDQSFVASTAQLSGLAYHKILGKELVNFLSSKGKANRAVAARLGMTLNYTFGVNSALSRFSDMYVAGGISKTTAGAADFTIRASLLSKLTQDNKTTVWLELLGAYTDNAHLSFSALPEGLRNTLKANAVSAADWDTIRSSKKVNLDGIDWLDTASMSDSSSSKILGLLHNEIKRAVPEPGAEIRALMTGGAPAGTMSREGRATASQFMGFTLSSHLSQIRRIIFHPGLATPMNKAQYTAKIYAYMFFTGALALNLKDLADGKDIRDPSDPQFMMEALGQGGGFGIAVMGRWPTQTDLKKATAGDMALGFLGPMPRTLFTIGAGVKRSLGQGELTPFMNSVLPNITPNIWYSDLLVQRYFLDEMKRITDPRAAAAFGTQRTNTLRRTGQGSWWGPGKRKPSRLPRISKPPKN